MNPFEIPEVLYYFVIGIAVAGWLALLLFPRRTWANFWFSGLVAPLVLCALYIYLLLSFWFLNPPGRLFSLFSLKDIYVMFGNSGLLLGALINLTAMGLVVGAWMTRKAAQTCIPYVYLVPCLVLTSVFAGFGFVLFAVVGGVGGRWPRIAELESIPPTDSVPMSASVLAWKA